MSFLGGKVRPARIADSSAVLVVPNVKVRLEAQHSIARLSRHDLLGESFTFLQHNTEVRQAVAI